MDKSVSVIFKGAELSIVEHNNQPFVPMKPIVAGMDLDWSYQRKKLADSSARWGVALIAIPSEGGNQDTVCMPLRKLAGWLMTIQPSSVKPEIRDTIRAYQNECDDVLWHHWMTIGLPTRFLVVIDGEKMTEITPVPNDAFIASSETLPGMVRDYMKDKIPVDRGDLHKLDQAWRQIIAADKSGEPV